MGSFADTVDILGSSRTVDGTDRSLEVGNIDLGKLQPVIFDSAKRTYRVVGEKVADAWGAGKTIIEKEVK